MSVLGRERNGPRPSERHTEAGEHDEVGAERDPRDASDAKRRKAVLGLQATDLALDGCAAR
jgi:hypothetical protein